MKTLSPYPKLKLLNLWRILQAMMMTSPTMNLDFLLKSDPNAYVVSKFEFFQVIMIDNDIDFILHILCSDSKSNKKIYILPNFDLFIFQDHKKRLDSLLVIRMFVFP